ncbi:MAG: hypothetical protein ACYCZR_02240 [Burkholderiales bacterium]
MNRHIQMLRRAAEGERPKQVPTSDQFEKDFNLVARHYGFSDSGEYETAWEAAMDDYDDAVMAYATIANEIRQEAS